MIIQGPWCFCRVMAIINYFLIGSPDVIGGNGPWSGQVRVLVLE